MLNKNIISEYELDIFRELLNRKGGFIYPTSNKAKKDVKQLLLNEFVYIDSFGSGKSVVIRATEKGINELR